MAATAVGFFLYRPVPLSITPVSREGATFETISEEIIDARVLELDVQLGEEQALDSSGEGTVTQVSCLPGTAISSGSSPFGLDGDPLLALHTRVPLWRDLAYGDEGIDVDALQEELDRLDYDVYASEVFDWQTWIAVAEMVEDLGGELPEGKLPLAGFLWLPGVDVVVQQCAASMGNTVARGDLLATLARSISAVRVKQMPSDLVPGERKLIIDDKNVSVGEEGIVAPEDTAVLMESSKVRAYLTDPDSDSNSLFGTLQLAVPVQVVPVPPSAVRTDDDGGGGCVLDQNGNSIPIKIMGSELGRTYIAFESEKATPKAVQNQGEENAACTLN